MKKTSLSSVAWLNIALYATLIVLVAGIGFGLYLMHSMLTDYARQANHRKIDNELTSESVARLQRVQKELDKNRSTVQKARSIVSDTKYYQYQDQIVQDLTSYAGAAGITILSFNFGSAPPGPTASPAAGQKPSQTTGKIKTVTAAITLESPIAYSSYLKFLKLIEKNLTKMQVTQINVTKDDKTNGFISAQTLELEVYVP